MQKRPRRRRMARRRRM